MTDQLEIFDRLLKQKQLSLSFFAKTLEPEPENAVLVGKLLTHFKDNFDLTLQ